MGACYLQVVRPYMRLHLMPGRLHRAHQTHPSSTQGRAASSVSRQRLRVGHPRLGCALAFHVGLQRCMLARSVGERGGSFGGDDGHFIVYAGDASEVSTCCSGDWRAIAERF